MKFFSTRDREHFVSFEDAVFNGLAPDGGLYFPADFPDMSDFFNSMTGETSFVEIATGIVDQLVGAELGEGEARRIAEEAFPFEPKLVKFEEGQYILELFHGPSCAFKDFGASFLATVMSAYLKKRGKKATILTATSGDTGSAVAQAFHNKENIEVVILYPSGRVSPLQEKQLTTLGGNIKALEIKGSFDDCQRMVKEAFLDGELKQAMTLTSANSINLGRLVPQSMYYAYGLSRIQDIAGKDGEVHFCVPSGNFGNLTAGIFAWKWGLKADGFLAATNANDVVPEYLKSGDYNPRASVHTISNAMDVGNPSNFERLETIFHHNIDAMRATVKGEMVTDDETKVLMKEAYQRDGSFIDPHTAVGLIAARRYRDSLENKAAANVVTLSTAHPGKFLEVVEEAVGVQPPLPAQLEALKDKAKVSVVIENTLEALKGFLLK